jgi:deoxycytidylate deaminase
MAAAEIPLPRVGAETSCDDSRGLILKHAANELVFAVVGHVGSGTSDIAGSLKESLLDNTLPEGPFEVHMLKARDVIREWARENKETLPDETKRNLKATERFQDLGDLMRGKKTTEGEPDYPAVARRLVLQIRSTRATSLGKPVDKTDPVPPDGKRRAYILDSLRHPAEVHLLRQIYQEAFILIGVVCEEKTRLERLRKKYPDAGDKALGEFMERDAEAKVKHGQHVADTFHLSDFFVDNTVSRLLDHDEANSEWDTNEKLGRLVKILTHAAVIRPEMSEEAMHHAHGAMMQSACLSRQVGAALVDRAGNVVATGTNEVPKAGGGVYGESFADLALGKNAEKPPDDRCAYRRPDGRKLCSNTLEQNRIIEELVNAVGDFIRLTPERKAKLMAELDGPKIQDRLGTNGEIDRQGLFAEFATIVDQLNSLTGTEKNDLMLKLRKTRVGGLLEFSRAVHAEMDALLSAARQGISPVGTRLFVTTFPCHYCARHLVTAGVDEVQYIEPYPKNLHL